VHRRRFDGRLSTDGYGRATPATGFGRVPGQ
jgi:hypothetical protein